MSAEPDRVAGAPVAAVIVGMVAIVIGIGIGVGVVTPRGRDAARPVPELDVPPADSFAIPTAHEQRRAEQRARRERWEWTDRAQGRARMPLALAIDAYLGEPR